MLVLFTGTKVTINIEICKHLVIYFSGVKTILGTFYGKTQILKGAADALAGSQSSFVVYGVPGEDYGFPDEVRREALSGSDVKDDKFNFSAVEPDAGADSPSGVVGSLQVYGMVRLLNARHILKFMAGREEISKNQILVNDSAGGNVMFTTAKGTVYSVCDSKLRKIESKNGFAAANGVVNLSVKELSEILFRPQYGFPRLQNGSDSVSESFDIPSMQLCASLLLD